MKSNKEQDTIKRKYNEICSCWSLQDWNILMMN